MLFWITCKSLLLLYLVMIGEDLLLGVLLSFILIVWKQVYIYLIRNYALYLLFTPFHLVGSFCTPYLVPNTEPITLEQLVEKLPNFSYQLHLVSPKAEEEINAHVSLQVPIVT